MSADRERSELALAARSRRLALIADVSGRLLLRGEPREQLKQAFDAVAHEVGSDLYFNYLVEGPGSQRLGLANSGGIDAATQARFAWIPIGRHLCGRVARDRCPLVLSNVHESTDADAKAIRDLGGRCYAGFPLLADDDLLGTIAFSSTKRSAFTDLDTELIATVASLFAAAIRRDRLTADLRRSEARYAAVFNSATIGLAETDLAGGFKSVNDRFCAITGRSREELLHRGVLDITHPDDVASNLDRIDHTTRTGEPFVMEKRYVRPDGSSVWGGGNVSLSRTPDGTVFGLAGAVIDITEDIHERLQAEESLRETKQRLDAVLDNATVAIFLMDERQQCVYMNAAAERLTGDTFAETQGRALHDVVHHTRPDGTPYPLWECPIDRAFPESNRESGEEVFVHRDGTFYPVAFTASPIRDDGRTVGTIIEVRDIRGEKAAQERQRLLTHELNHRVKNTLAVMQSVASMTARFTPEPEAFRKAFSARLIAISRVHDILTRGAWSGATLAEVVEVTLAPYAARGASSVEAPTLR